MNKYQNYFYLLIKWPALVLAFHIICTYPLGWYNTMPWLDMPMHFLGGVAISASTIILFSILAKERKLEAHHLVLVLGVFSSVALAATLWELMEFAGDLLLKTNMQPSTADTMIDYTMAFLGAIIITSLWQSKKSDRQRA